MPFYPCTVYTPEGQIKQVISVAEIKKREDEKLKEDTLPKVFAKKDGGKTGKLLNQFQKFQSFLDSMTPPHDPKMYESIR